MTGIQHGPGCGGQPHLGPCDDPPPLRPPRTRVPRVFNIWGTIVYAVCSITAFICLVSAPFWRPPLSILLPMYIYVFASTGIICLGRIEANKDAKFFIQALRQRSEENKKRSEMN